MKIDTETFYLYYILLFLDNDMEICQSINETFCSQSIRGTNLDSFHQIHGMSYQFILTEKHCIVNSLKKHFLNSNKELLWIKPVIEHHILKFPQFDQVQNSCKSEFCDQKKQQIFYSRIITLRIRRELFEKISNNPHNYEKNYSIEEIFFILHSYVFSHFDNRISILKNILYLIFQESFDLNDIHYIFIEYTSKIHASSKYLKKLNEKITSSNEINIQQSIDCFLKDHYHQKSNDEFLNDLFSWNLKCVNLFFLIRQKICFQIRRNQTKTDINIFYSSDYESTYDIFIDNFEVLLFFLSDEYIFSCEYFSSEINHFFSRILEIKPSMKFQIDITKIYQRLNSSRNIKIFRENILLENFFEFLFNKINDSILLIIYSNKFNLKKNGKDYELKKFNEKIPFIINESMTISSNILINNINEIGNLLKVLAETILLYSINDNLGKINIIFIGLENNIHQFICGEQTLDRYVASNPYFYNLSIRNRYNELIQLFAINGLNYKERVMFRISGFNQKYENLDFLAGTFNHDFSFFVIDPQYYKTSKSLNLISKLSTSIKNQYSKNNIEMFAQNFELFENNLQISEYLIFHIESHHNKGKQSLKTCQFVGLCSEIINCSFCEQKLSFEIHARDKMNGKEILKLNYNNIFAEEKDSFCCENSKEELEPVFWTPRGLFFDLDIKQTNFHVIILDFLECQSKEKTVSSISENDYLSHIIEINHCYVKILSLKFHVFELISMNNCIIDNDFELFSDKFFDTHLNLSFCDFQLLNPIIVWNFAKIETLDNENDFFSSRDKGYHILELRNCKISIFENIPQYFTRITLSKCEILVTINDISLNTKYFIDQRVKLDKLANLDEKIISSDNSDFDMLIDDCLLPENLKITGSFNLIKMTNCISSLKINSNCHEIEIQNHQGEFSVNSVLNKAISKGTNSLFKFEDKTLILQNLQIHSLVDIELDELDIDNCHINKIDNVKSTLIDIHNSKCSFLIKDSTGFKQFSGENLDFFDAENVQMTMLDYNNSVELN